MKIRFTIGLVLVLIHLSSCYTYKIFPIENRHYKLPAERQLVYVENVDFEKEYKILKYSEIFEFTSDSTDKSAAHIRLRKLQNKFACGDPLISFVLFLGQIPTYFPDRREFTFEIVKSDSLIEKKFELQVATRYWFWDIFSTKNFNKTAGHALASLYYR